MTASVVVLSVVVGDVVVVASVVVVGVVDADVVVAARSVVVGVDVVAADDVVVVLSVVVDEVVVVAAVVVVAVDVVDAGGFASWPLSASAAPISCSTAATWAAIASGVAAAPSAEIASSFCSAASIFCTSSGVGCEVSVTTIWFANAAVRQTGQLTFNDPAALIGAIVALRPTMSTTWNPTATVVHARQLAKANAPFVFVTGAPPDTVTSM